ncbi:MAG TPA: HAD family hydrolase [Acidobacteriota bacterium]|nr:HAD family hydrolase [Acidobacteriota bacterium]HNT17143.1 HAD family hydrolase [Acidobacteriota bacterium]
MKLLLFDIDGTLLRPMGFGKKAFQKAFEKVCGTSPAGDFPYDGLLDREICAKTLEMSGFEPEEGLMVKLMERYIEQLPSEIPEDSSKWLCENVPNILSEAGRKGFCLAVVTGNVREAAEIKLGSTGLSRFFPAGAYGSDASERWELIPIAVGRAETHYGREFPAERTYMIGDSVRDIDAAKKAGVRSISVATGLAPYSRLSKESPDFLLGDLSSDGFWELPL